MKVSINGFEFEATYISLRIIDVSANRIERKITSLLHDGNVQLVSSGQLRVDLDGVYEKEIVLRDNVSCVNSTH
jgi:hypothetical protein